MRNRLAAVVLWCAATGGAVVLVSGGVSTIRSATRRDAVVDVHAIAVSEAGRSTSTGGTGAPATTLVAAPSTTIPIDRPTTVPDAAAPPTTAPRAATTPAATAPTTSAPATSAPTTTAPPSPVTAAPAPSTVTRTISSRGGSVTVRADASSVVVVAATPNPGYAAKVDQRGAVAVRVEFESSAHRSRIDASWTDGLQDEVRED